jgi:hypothetical protein
MTTRAEVPPLSEPDDDADTGLPVALAVGAAILLGLVGLLWLCWGVLVGVVK